MHELKKPDKSKRASKTTRTVQLRSIQNKVTWMSENASSHVLTNQIRDADFWEFSDEMTKEELTAIVFSSHKSTVLLKANLIGGELAPLWSLVIKRKGIFRKIT